MRPAATRDVASRLSVWRVLGPPVIFASLALAPAGCAADPLETEVKLPGHATSPPRPDLESAGVVSVIDGVTIEVEVGGQVFEVRYLGVDLPLDESNPDSSRRALEFNRFLVEGETVELERGVAETDSLGRLLRYVYADGEMVNMALLANGHATVSGFPAEFAQRESFQIAEQTAKRDLRGFWARADSGATAKGDSPPSTPNFAGGTLPSKAIASFCDYSGTPEPVIKGNVDSRTDDRIYHVPGGFFYSTTVVDMGSGDLLFCTEEQARAAGWRRAAH